MTEQKSNYAIQMSSVKKDFIPTPREMKTINSYMFMRAIINHPKGAILARVIDESKVNIPQKVQYWWVRSVFHNINSIRTCAIPSTKNAILEFLSTHYNCSWSVANDYYKILGDEGVSELKKLYKQGLE